MGVCAEIRHQILRGKAEVVAADAVYVGTKLVSKAVVHRPATHEFASAAFTTATTKKEFEYVRMKKPGFIIVDYLIDFRGVNDKVEWRLRDLFKQFMRHVDNELLRDPLCDTIIMVCDDKTNVNKDKAPTQKARAIAQMKSDRANGVAECTEYRLAKGHEHDWKLSEMGLEYTSETMDKKPLKVVQEKVDLRSLKKLDKTNKRLWDAFRDMAIEELRGNEAMRGKTFIFDYDNDKGAYHIDDGASTISGSNPYPAHNLGEADPAVFWWIDYMRQRRPELVEAHIVTSDTDMIPLYCLYHVNVMHREAFGECDASERYMPGLVLWHMDKAGTVCDLRMMAELIMAKGDMTLRRFALFCIMCGNCDYVTSQTKALYSYNMGPRKIYAKMIEVQKEIDRMRHEHQRLSIPMSYTSEVDFFRMFIACVHYGDEMKCNNSNSWLENMDFIEGCELGKVQEAERDASLEACLNVDDDVRLNVISASVTLKRKREDPPPIKGAKPSQLTVKRIAEMVSNNYHYWNSAITV